MKSFVCCLQPYSTNFKSPVPTTPVFRRGWLTLLAICLLAIALQRVSASPTTVDGATVEKFTGGHTRVVWLTDAENKDSFSGNNKLQLMGYDSRGGRGERIIWGERRKLL